jgi:hypothetical protein
MRLVVLLLSGLGLLASLSAVSEAHAASTLHVPADYPTIQLAINAAGLNDTVLVEPGTYNENLDLSHKLITLESSAGPELTTIAAANAGQAVVKVGTYVPLERDIVRGFTIRGGTIGVHQSDYGAVTVEDNIVEGNSGCAGIVIEYGFALVQGNTIRDNSGSCGGGVYVGSDEEIDINGNSITGNVSIGVDGGGITVYGRHARILRNLIADNRVTGLAESKGGGITLLEGYVANNILYRNFATLGGGIAAGSGVALINNTVVGNIAAHGSAVYSIGYDRGSGPYANNILASNDGTPALDCVLYPYGGPPPTVIHNIIYSPGGSGTAGACSSVVGVNGNLSVDPMVRDVTTGNFHLLAGSPAIDAGDNSAPQVPNDDFDGNIRPADGDGDGVATVDIGAFEGFLPVGGDVMLAVGSAASPWPVPLAVVLAAPTLLAVAGAFVWRRRRA